MSQTLNLTAFMLAIDNSSVAYNFSAWLGGYRSDDDNARVSLSFLNNVYQTIDSEILLGPIYASDRESITKLMFCSQLGLVPIDTRYMNIVVTTEVFTGPYCDGYIDNIPVIFTRI